MMIEIKSDKDDSLERDIRQTVTYRTIETGGIKNGRQGEPKRCSQERERNSQWKGLEKEKITLYTF